MFLLVQEVGVHVELPTHHFRGEALPSRERLHALLSLLVPSETSIGPEMVLWLELQGLPAPRVTDPEVLAEVEALRSNRTLHGDDDDAA